MLQKRPETGYAEMIIHGDDVLNSLLTHHDETGAVREREGLVAVLAKQLLRAVEPLGVDPLEIQRNRLLEQIKEPERRCRPRAGLRQRT